MNNWVRIQINRHSRIGFNVPPDAGQIKTLPLLRNVVKETMRMYHPLGLNIREAKKDTCLPVGGGPDGKQPVAILKGQQVGMLRTSQGIFQPMMMELT